LIEVGYRRVLDRDEPCPGHASSVFGPQSSAVKHVSDVLSQKPRRRSLVYCLVLQTHAVVDTLEVPVGYLARSPQDRVF